MQCPSCQRTLTKGGRAVTSVQNKWGVPGHQLLCLGELLFKKIQRYNLLRFYFCDNSEEVLFSYSLSQAHMCPHGLKKNSCFLALEAYHAFFNLLKKRVQHKREHLQVNRVTLTAPLYPNALLLCKETLPHRGLTTGFSCPLSSLLVTYFHIF